MAHTLTFNYDDPSSGYTVRKGSISGEEVHSPYTLQNGDELYFVTVKINNTINGTSYSSSDLENTTLEFADVDINIVGASGPQFAIDANPFVLKYTESGGSTLTFKHFYDAGLQGTGTYKFRHYSQQEPSSGETWVLNETLSSPTFSKTSIGFVSNGVTYLAISSSNSGTGPNKQSWLFYYYGDNITDKITAWYYENGAGTWNDQAYRTITFATSPTGDLLTWLQANGTKQGGGGQ